MSETNTANAGTDVNQAQSSSVTQTAPSAGAVTGAKDDSYLDAFFAEESKSKADVGESPSPDAETAQGPASDTPPVDEANKAESPPAKEPEEKSKLQQRFDKLTAKLKAAEEALQHRQYELELARKERELEAMSQKEREFVAARNGGKLDEKDVIILQMQQQMRELQEKAQFSQQWEQRVQEERQKAAHEVRVGQYLDEMNSAFSKYEKYYKDNPVIEAAYRNGLATAIRTKDGISAEEAMKQVHDSLFKAYEPEVISKHKPKLNAPAPMTPTGSTAVRKGPRSKEEAIQELDAALGPDWILA